MVDGVLITLRLRGLSSIVHRSSRRKTRSRYQNDGGPRQCAAGSRLPSRCRRRAVPPWTKSRHLIRNTTFTMHPISAPQPHGWTRGHDAARTAPLFGHRAAEAKVHFAALSGRHHWHVRRELSMGQQATLFATVGGGEHHLSGSRSGALPNPAAAVAVQGGFAPHGCPARSPSRLRSARPRASGPNRGERFGPPIVTPRGRAGRAPARVPARRHQEPPPWRRTPSNRCAGRPDRAHPDRPDDAGA